MLKTYVTVISGETRDWEGMLPLMPVGSIVHRNGTKLIVTDAHITLRDDDELDGDGIAVQFISVSPLG